MSAAFVAALPRLLTAADTIDVFNAEVAQTVGGNLVRRYCSESSAPVSGLCSAISWPRSSSWWAGPLSAKGSSRSSPDRALSAGSPAASPKRSSPAATANWAATGGPALAAYAGTLAIASLVTLRRDIA